MDLATQIAAIREEILDEYQQPHSYPWIIGYSGGKDSTVVAHLVVEALLSLAPGDRRRPVHVVANDTLVESPLVVLHIDRMLSAIHRAGTALKLPVVVAKTTPDPNHTFWVNLIGRGYPAPSRSFRWCTDRLKIQPTSSYIRAQANAAGKVILLLGVRRQESAKRAASINRYSNGQRLSAHNDLAGCLIFRPIVELSTDEVWEFLGSSPPPWGGSHSHLIKLYRDAGGGECPVVTSKSEAPSCGSTSSRFGCWTCTVVAKDRSLEGFVEAGFTEFGPLLEFRDWLAAIRNDPTKRMIRRRTGKLTLRHDGELVLGPFTLQVRRDLLARVIDLGKVTCRRVITDNEINRIKEIWAEDAIVEARAHAIQSEVATPT